MPLRSSPYFSSVTRVQLGVQTDKSFAYACDHVVVQCKVLGDLGPLLFFPRPCRCLGLAGPFYGVLSTICEDRHTDKASRALTMMCYQPDLMLDVSGVIE